MDPSRFDRLSRALAAAATRRAALVALVGGLLTSVVADEEIEASKNRRNDRGDGGKDDARKNHDRGRDQHGGVQAEKKKKGNKKKKKKAPACPNGQSRCGAGCVDTNDDDANCGRCGTVCAGEEACQGGGCCPQGQHFCDGACVNRLTNASHCRECGRECADNQICRDGLCGVPCGATGICLDSTEPSCCGTECVSTERNSRNCGACGNDCQTQRANICVESTCRCGFSGAPCPEAETCCTLVGLLGECRNTNTDKDHCGACLAPCDSQIADRCVGGTCKCGGGNACVGGQRCCNGNCRDITTTSFCGGCTGACNLLKADRCVGGVCKCGSSNACGAGQTCCGGGVCRNTNSDVNSCGGCGIVCNVNAGEICCNGLCTDPFTDIDHCGDCGNACPGSRQSTNSDIVCNDGECAMTCRGQNYDINFDVSNGCEEEDPQTNHTKGTASWYGEQTCSDGDVRVFAGVIFSDARVHNPEPPGFIADELAAPLWFSVTPIGGGFCQEDVVITLGMEGGTDGCYQLTVRAEGNFGGKQETKVVQNGLASISMNYVLFDNTIYFKVEKICGPPELAFFEAQYHL